MSTPKQLPNRQFAEGEILMRQGDKGREAWFIQEGEVEIFSGEGGSRKVLATRKGRFVVGEMALIDNGVRVATVQAKAPTLATSIPRESFNKMLEECEPLGRYLLSNLVNALRAQLGLETIEPHQSEKLFRSTDDPSRILERRIFAPDATVFRQGDSAEAAYLIQAGAVHIMMDGKKIATLGPGRTFGEIALLKHDKRSAEAVASERGLVVEIIRRPEFEDCVKSMPTILQSLAQAYIGYLANLRPFVVID